MRIIFACFVVYILVRGRLKVYADLASAPQSGDVKGDRVKQ